MTVTPNPVVRPDPGNVTVGAVVAATYDQDSSTSTSGRCTAVRIAGTITSYTETVTSTTVTVTNKAATASASDSNGNANAASDASAGTYSGTLPDGPEGKTAVTVTATSTENLTTETDTTVNTYSSTDSTCSGTPTSSVPSLGTPSTTTKTSAGSSSRTYLVDLQAPVLSARINGAGSVREGSTLNVGVHIDGGSAGTAFSVDVTASGPTVYSGSDYATFGSIDATGIAPPKELALGLPIPCGAPLGTYTVSVTLHAVDLAGSGWDDATVGPGSVAVTPAVDLSSDTLVVSELATGDYGLFGSFTAASAGGKISTNPGSFHIAEVVQTAGSCAGYDTISFKPSGQPTTDVTLTIDPAFSYVKSGKSPIAHVFAGVLPAGGLLDYHNPAVPEVTGSVKQSVSGNTISIDLGGLGTLPANTIVYVRAHDGFSSTTLPSNTSYTFSSTDHLDQINGYDYPLANSSSALLVGNPSP